MHAWLEWARGPAFIFCFTFMVLGLLRHAVVTVWETTRIMRRAGDKSLPAANIWRATLSWLFPAKALRREPLFTGVSVVFHAAILIAPVFLTGHIVLWQRGVGLSWPAIPNGLADVLTVLAVVMAAGLAVLRRTAKATRGVTTPSDYALLAAVALPFVTGFLVMHPAFNPLSLESALFLHVMSGNLVFVLLPTTKLAHAILLPGTQVVAEVGWHWPMDAGSRVGAALGKEAEPV